MRRFAFALVLVVVCAAGRSGLLAQPDADGCGAGPSVAVPSPQVAAGEAGRPELATTSGSSLRLDVTEDEAVVRDRDNGNHNYHDNTHRGGLFVGCGRLNGGNSPSRSYLKFSLSSLPTGASISQATLYAYLNDEFYSADRAIGAYVAGDGWSETTITWNNAPATTGGPCDTLSPPFSWGHWYSWDVTAPVGAEAAGDGVLTLVLREVVEDTATPTWNYFAEDEYNSSLAAYIDVEFTAPPVADAGDDQTVEQETATGTQVTLDGSGTSWGVPPLTYDWYEDWPGTLLGTGETLAATFQLGHYDITLVVTDAAGDSDSDECEVTVVDTTPPELTVPDDITVEQESADGAAVTWVCSATDICDADVDTSCVPGSGWVFPLGQTVVTCTACDVSGNAPSKTFTVTVEDTTDPSFSLNVLKDRLWPPNHKMHLCATVTDVSDICDADPVVSIVVTSNEPVNGKGDGNTHYDWEVIQNGDVWEIWLRAERDGRSSDREYTIDVTVIDAAGNDAQASATVTVPGDQGKGKSK